MSQQQADDDQLPSADSPPKADGYPARSLLGRAQPAPEILEDLFSLSGPVSRAYRSLVPLSDPNSFCQHRSCERPNLLLRATEEPIHPTLLLSLALCFPLLGLPPLLLDSRR
jgi:hypothetical protein